MGFFCAVWCVCISGHCQGEASQNLVHLLTLRKVWKKCVLTTLKLWARLSVSTKVLAEKLMEENNLLYCFFLQPAWTRIWQPNHRRSKFFHLTRVTVRNGIVTLNSICSCDGWSLVLPSLLCCTVVCLLKWSSVFWELIPFLQKKTLPSLQLVLRENLPFSCAVSCLLA